MVAFNQEMLVFGEQDKESDFFPTLQALLWVMRGVYTDRNRCSGLIRTIYSVANGVRTSRSKHIDAAFGLERPWELRFTAAFADLFCTWPSALELPCGQFRDAALATASGRGTYLPLNRLSCRERPHGDSSSWSCGPP